MAAGSVAAGKFSSLLVCVSANNRCSDWAKARGVNHPNATITANFDDRIKTVRLQDFFQITGT